ncbi:oligosaccharide flippase family protein [Buttiauxella noackiae]|uniref:oligosaccharide flippase family protein n=1 Tax=Buttiauxella noackiae TaxID=82992 RepID=UPI00054F09E2|nr:oligosaccharide flippase family protein [Buttiauxella noackiae]
MSVNIKRETAYLYVVQISNIILPLIMVPYLAHVLGLDFFGKLSFAQAVSYICIFIVDFGFNFSAARGIGINIGKNKEIDKLYSNVQFVKIILFSIVVVFLFFLSLFINLSVIDSKLMLLGGISSLSSIVMPVWLFQGLGRNSYVAVLNLITRVFSMVFILLLIKSDADIITASSLQLLSPLVAGVIMQYFMIKKEIVRFKVKDISVSNSVTITKDSFHNFSASFLTLGFTYFNPILVKLFLGDSALGLYSFAEKLANVLRQLYIPLVQACFSKICILFQEGNTPIIRKIILKVFVFFTILTVIAYVGNVFLGDFIISLFFSQSASVSQLLLIMIITQGVISYSMILVNLIIIPAGFSFYLKRVYFKALVSYAVVIYPLIHFFGVYGVASSIVAVEIIIVACFGLFICKKKILLN